MKSFRSKYPNLTEEQLQLKYKIWQREKERERLLTEAREKKKYKDPFSRDDDNGEEGTYDGGLDIDQSNNGVVSDGPISGANIEFVYPQNSGGFSKYTKSDSKGNFLVPRSFGSGTIIVRGGIDTVTGLQYNGQFIMDGPFFHTYRAVTPLTHISNHIWNCTPTRIPVEAINLVMDYIFHFFDIPHSDLDSFVNLFNKDHIRLTLDEVKGGKQIQAINTILEIYADLISGLKANHPHELEYLKIETYSEIGNALLTRVNGQESKNYFNNIFKFHVSGQEKNHDKCCIELLERASFEIKESLKKSPYEATCHMQSINLIVKEEWTHKTLKMTEDLKITPNKLWDTIENKEYTSVLDRINLDTIYL